MGTTYCMLAPRVKALLLRTLQEPRRGASSSPYSSIQYNSELAERLSGERGGRINAALALSALVDTPNQVKVGLQYNAHSCTRMCT